MPLIPKGFELGSTLSWPIWSIAGFHFHTIIKTIQQIKSRIKEVKEDEYSNSLPKIQVCAMFRAGDIRRNVLLKFKIKNNKKNIQFQYENFAFNNLISITPPPTLQHIFVWISSYVSVVNLNLQCLTLERLFAAFCYYLLF